MMVSNAQHYQQDCASLAFNLLFIDFILNKTILTKNQYIAKLSVWRPAAYPCTTAETMSIYLRALKIRDDLQ